MKTLSLLIFTLFCTISAIAQPWIGTVPGNIYYNQGNVGIGTNTPIEKLTIAGGHGDTKLRLFSTGNGSDQPSNLSLWASEPGVTYFGTGIGYNVNGSPYYGRIDNSRGSSYVRFLPGETKFEFQNGSGSPFNDVLVIKESGNVGIGTANPVDKLHVSGGDIGIDQPYAFKFANDQSIRDNSGGGLAINSNTYKLQLIGGTDPTNGLIELLTNNAIRMTVLNNGNVGIGTTTPGAILHVYNNSSTAPLDMSNTSALTLQNPYTTAGNTGSAIFFKSDTRGYNTFAGIGGNMIGADANGAYGDIVFGTKATSAATTLSERMRISSGGNVGIGTTTPEAKLTVKGKIVASEIQVKADNLILPDYVFKPDYQLMSLDKVENFVKQNQHLPEVPSEKEFKKDGMNVAEMNALLLKKVEELTLYAIEQNKKIETLEKTVNNLISK